MAGKRGRSTKNDAKLLAEALAIATAINEGQRGQKKGRKRGAVRELLIPLESSRGQLVAPHGSLTKKCKRCGEYHGKGVHSSHGPGSFAMTHPKHLSKRQTENILADALGADLMDVL